MRGAQLCCTALADMGSQLRVEAARPATSTTSTRYSGRALTAVRQGTAPHAGNAQPSRDARPRDRGDLGAPTGADRCVVFDFPTRTAINNTIYQPPPMGTVMNLIPSADFTRISMVCLPAFCADSIALRRSMAAATFLSAA